MSSTHLTEDICLVQRCEKKYMNNMKQLIHRIIFYEQLNKTE